MNAVYIFPEDIGVTGEWSDKWKDLCEKFGYDREKPPVSLLVSEIKITN
ncbi:hypothetical protein PV783_33970 [Chitinophaga sp. CC14]